MSHNEGRERFLPSTASPPPSLRRIKGEEGPGTGTGSRSCQEPFSLPSPTPHVGDEPRNSVRFGSVWVSVVSLASSGAKPVRQDTMLLVDVAVDGEIAIRYHAAKRPWRGRVGRPAGGFVLFLALLFCFIYLYFYFIFFPQLTHASNRTLVPELLPKR